MPVLVSQFAFWFNDIEMRSPYTFKSVTCTLLYQTGSLPWLEAAFKSSHTSWPDGMSSLSKESISATLLGHSNWGLRSPAGSLTLWIISLRQTWTRSWKSWSQFRPALGWFSPIG